MGQCGAPVCLPCPIINVTFFWWPKLIILFEWKHEYQNRFVFCWVIFCMATTRYAHWHLRTHSAKIRLIFVFSKFYRDSLSCWPEFKLFNFKLALSRLFPFCCLSKNPCCSMSCVPLGGMCKVSETYLEIDSAVVMFSCTKWRPIQTILSTRSRLLCGFDHFIVHCAFDARCFTLEHSKVLFGGHLDSRIYVFSVSPSDGECRQVKIIWFFGWTGAIKLK